MERQQPQPRAQPVPSTSERRPGFLRLLTARQPAFLLAVFRECNKPFALHLDFALRRALRRASTFPPWSAIRAKAEEKDFVILHQITGWRQALDVWQAPLHFEHALAAAAAEMMVVAAAGDFVARRLAANLHLRQHALFHQRSHGAVHSGDAEPRDRALGQIEYLSDA
jgi:hypothetical protein